MNPIWKKDGQDASIDQGIQNFLAGEDVLLDRELFLFDIQASIAHVNGLYRIDILDKKEQEQLVNCLEQLAVEFRQGTFILDAGFEDGHSALEQYLTEKLGSVAGKVHTGRSRNDQVSVATRLYMRAQLDQLESIVADIAYAFLNKAEEFSTTPLPGYTHLQRAMPSSIGLWLGGMAEAFVDNLEMVRATWQWLNKNPLGTASGFGINLPLDRDGVSEELGFAGLQVNPQNVQNSRGKFEFQSINALSLCTLDLRRFAWDLSIYTSAEFGFVQLPDKYVTGSSIMPNKRNPDVVELLRSVHATVEACNLELQNITALPSSYHRDLQNTKPPLIRAFKKGLQALSLLPDLIRDMIFNEDRMLKAIDAEMYATDLAIEAAKQGANFRDVYKRVMQDSRGFSAFSTEQSISGRVSQGGTGNLMLHLIKERLDHLS